MKAKKTTLCDLNDPPSWLRHKWKRGPKDGMLMIGGAHWPGLEVCFFDLPIFVKDYEVLEECAHYTHRAIEILRDPYFDEIHRTLQLHPFLLNAVLTELSDRGCVKQGSDQRWRSMFPAARERNGRTEVRRHQRAIITYVPSLEVLLTVTPSIQKRNLLGFISNQGQDYQKLSDHFSSLLAKDSERLYEMGLPERYTLNEDLSDKLIDIAALIGRPTVKDAGWINDPSNRNNEEERQSQVFGIGMEVELFLTLWTKFEGGVWKIRGEFELGAMGFSKGKGLPQKKSVSICDRLSTLCACLGTESETLIKSFELESSWQLSGLIDRGTSEQTLFTKRGIGDKRSSRTIKVLEKALSAEGNRVGSVYWAFETSKSEGSL